MKIQIKKEVIDFSIFFSFSGCNLIFSNNIFTILKFRSIIFKIYYFTLTPARKS